MNKFIWLGFLSLMTSAHANDLLRALTDHQGNLSSASDPKIETPAQEVRTTSVSSSSTGGICTETDQTSIPLAYITSLIQDPNGKLNVKYDPRRGILEVSSPSMISNCSNMIDWKLKDQIINGKKVYSIEAKIKQGENCTEDGCDYKIAKSEGGSFREWETRKLKPTLNGFEQCLTDSGVISNGTVQSGKLFTAQLSARFHDVKDSGEVLFTSHGPRSQEFKGRYGDFVHIDRCDHYEKIIPEGRRILSYEDEQRESLDAQAEKLKQCSINEYQKVADFIERYQSYADELGAIRDNLILENVKKSVKAIDSGKYTDEDLKIIQDFNKYIVTPKAEEIAKISKMLETTEDINQKSELTARLKSLKEELKKLNAKPFFQSSHVLKLVKEGKFDDAEKMNTAKLILDSFSKVGNKSGSTIITAERANSTVAREREKFANYLEVEKERYAVRTGEITGRSAYYQSMSDQMKYNVQLRTKNYNEEIAAEYGRVQQGGYCYAYFRNTQKCIQDSLERIKELQALLDHYNKIDLERSKEYDEKKEDYKKMEAEGRRYVAAQNGEEVPSEDPEESSRPVDTVVPTPRADPGTYTFNYQPQMPSQMPQQQMMPQGGYNPYQSYGYQQPFMGQQAFSNPYGSNPMGGGYSFQWGGGATQSPYGSYGGYPSSPYSSYGQPSTGGYWGQPYSAYNMYSMYGR